MPAGNNVVVYTSAHPISLANDPGTLCNWANQFVSTRAFTYSANPSGGANVNVSQNFNGSAQFSALPAQTPTTIQMLMVAGLTNYYGNTWQVAAPPQTITRDDSVTSVITRTDSSGSEVDGGAPLSFSNAASSAPNRCNVPIVTQWVVEEHDPNNPAFVITLQTSTVSAPALSYNSNSYACTFATTATGGMCGNEIWVKARSYPTIDSGPAITSPWSSYIKIQEYSPVSVVVNGTPGSSVTLAGNVIPGSMTQTLTNGSAVFNFKSAKAGQVSLNMSATLDCYTPLPSTPVTALTCQNNSASFTLTKPPFTVHGVVRYGSTAVTGLMNCKTPPSPLANGDPICGATVTLLKGGATVGVFPTRADGSFDVADPSPDASATTYGLSVTAQGFDPSVQTLKTFTVSKCSSPGEQDLYLYLTPPQECPIHDTNPVNPLSGERTLTVTDLSVPGKAGLDFTFTRINRNSGSLSDLGLGLGWTTNWTVWLEPDGRGNFRVFFTDGKYHLLAPDPANPGSYKGVPGFFYTLQPVGSLWALVDTQGTRYQFDAQLRLAGITDRFGNQIQVNRDSQGRIMSVVDTGGRSYTFTYDAVHMLTMTAPDPQASHGNVWTFNYTQGDLTSVDGPGAGSGYHAVYKYDANNWMIHEDEPKNPTGLKHLDIHYDAAGRTISESRSATNEVVASMVYGLNGTGDMQYTVEGYSARVLVDAYGRSSGRQVGSNATAVQWDAQNQGATLNRDFRGNVTTMAYYPTNRGELQSSTDPSNLVTTYKYDPYGFGVVIERDSYDKNAPAKKRIYLSNVNNLGQVLSYQDGAPDRVTTYRYDPQGFGQWTYRQDPDGGVTTRDFYGSGQVLRITDQTDNLVTEYTYDGWGRVKTSVNKASGLTTAFTYDGAGNVIQTDYTDSYGHTQTSASYYDDGMLKASADEKGNGPSYSYTSDGRDNLMLETGAGGLYTNQPQYQPSQNQLSGEILSGPDGLGGSYIRTHDYTFEQNGCCSAQGRMVTDTIHGAQVGSVLENLTTTFGYDLDGNRNQTLSAQPGHDENDIYDGNDRLTHRTLGTGVDASTEIYGYNAFGERSDLTDGNNHNTHFDLDLHGQIYSEDPPQGNSIGYGYTPQGRQNKKTDRLGRIWNASYDNAGRILHEDFAGLSGTLNHDFHYGQVGDGSDQLLWVQDPTGRTDFSYSHRGRLDTTTFESSNRKLGRQYDHTGNLTQLTLMDGSGGALGQCGYDYDALNHIKSFTDWAGNLFTYRYDSAGQLRQVQCLPAGKSSPLYTSVNQYDAAGQLLSVTYRRGNTGHILSQVTYSYDAAGNRTARNTLASSASYGYDTRDEVTVDQNTANHYINLGFSYDLAGNRESQTWGAGQTQSYTLDNVLNRVEKAMAGPYGNFNFGYDVEGNRSSQTVTLADGIVKTNGSTLYQWDGKDRLGQVTLPDGTAINYTYDYQNRMVVRAKVGEVRTYLYGGGTQVLAETLNGQSSALYGWGADGLESRIDVDGKSLFYLKDGLGSIVAVLSGTGSIVQSYEYSAFGEGLAGKDRVNSFCFVGSLGGRTDIDTGLIYFWNRWYDPNSGRWISEDPARQIGGSDLYEYSRNSPINLADISGRDPVPVPVPLPPPTNPYPHYVPGGRWRYTGKHGAVYVGEASFYDPEGTASGEDFEDSDMVGAMTPEKIPTLPLGGVKVDWIDHCKSITVRIIDTGPWTTIPGTKHPQDPLVPNPTRVIDLSPGAFKALAGSLDAGTLFVRVTIP